MDLFAFRTEKNVRFLGRLSEALLRSGQGDFEFMIVGQGAAETWLREHVACAEFPGVLRGIPLAEAYADMDLFVFPSTTDTLGNVILETLASGLPVVVTSSGGPKFLVQHGTTGYIASTESEFIGYVSDLLVNRTVYARMRESARGYAANISWDQVFEEVFQAYTYCMEQFSAIPARSMIARLMA